MCDIMTNLDRLNAEMAKTPVASTTVLREAGVHPRTINAAIEAGTLFKPASGLVCTPEAYAHPDLEYAICCLKTGGIVARLSAATWHDLVDALPPAIEMIVPVGVTSVPKDLNVRRWRSRTPESLTIGIEKHNVFGVEFRITNPARTVVDLFRDRTGNVGDDQHKLTALRNFLGSHDASELQVVAREFGIQAQMQPYIDATLEALKGPTP